MIVSKAWRDGATPKDVITSYLLTCRSAKAHFVRRPIHRVRRPGKPFYNRGPQYWLEEVKWMDDTDFMLMRCQSLGAGTMKGFEMFTIGDCQSILLKMTSDNCTVRIIIHFGSQNLYDVNLTCLPLLHRLSTFIIATSKRAEIRNGATNRGRGINAGGNRFRWR